MEKISWGVSVASMDTKVIELVNFIIMTGISCLSGDTGFIGRFYPDVLCFVASFLSLSFSRSPVFH